jgi:hypothetical protein
MVDSDKGFSTIDGSDAVSILATDGIVRRWCNTEDGYELHAKSDSYI